MIGIRSIHTVLGTLRTVRRRGVRASLIDLRDRGVEIVLPKDPQEQRIVLAGIGSIMGSFCRDPMLAAFGEGLAQASIAQYAAEMGAKLARGTGGTEIHPSIKVPQETLVEKSALPPPLDLRDILKHAAVPMAIRKHHDG